jgi:hypothetical protein
VAERIRTRGAAEWSLLLDGVGVPCGVVRGVLEALGSADASPLTGVAPSIPPGQIRRPPPRLDEQGDQIRELGWAALAGWSTTSGS